MIIRIASLQVMAGDRPLLQQGSVHLENMAILEGRLYGIVPHLRPSPNPTLLRFHPPKSPGISQPGDAPPKLLLVFTMLLDSNLTMIFL